MFFEEKKRALIRALIGGVAGMLALLLIGLLAGSISLYSGSRFQGLVLVDGPMVQRLGGSEGLAIAVQFLLFFLLGAAAGTATLPFADDGRTLLYRSALHFIVTAALVALAAWLNFGPYSLLAWLALLALVYLLIWLGRWVGWYAEVAAIREKLGLPPGPSPLHWRETLPYLLFALGLCLGLPALLRWLDSPMLPVLTTLLFPYLLLPVGAFFSGLSLGRRHGFCPLYPLACALFSLAGVFLLFNSTALFHCALSLGFSLAGTAAGGLLKRRSNRHEG